MLTAPVFYPPLRGPRMTEKTGLTTSRKLQRSGYGSALSTTTALTAVPPGIHKPSLCNPPWMTSDSVDVEMRPSTRGELQFRCITSLSVRLPEEPWYKRIRVPGVFNRTSPHSNAVHTTKYTVITFLPKNLWEQFHRFANIFFLFIALLNFVPEVQAFGKEIGYLPLLFVLAATAVKDIFEDYRRYRSDTEVNAKLCRVYNRELKTYVQRQWTNVRVGDFVELECDEVIPADLLLLATSDPHYICYIETANIDGETNLKQRGVVPGIVDDMLPLGPLDHFDPSYFSGELFAEQPHSKINQFNGYVDVGGGRRFPVDRGNLLLRGCVLRNTTRVAGLVVYAGHQTKALLNNSGPRAKRSKLEKDINTDVFFQLALLLVICTIGAIGSGVWTSENVGKNITYFPFNDLDPALEAFIRFWTYIIIYQVIIPVSLYVTIEIIKIIQVYFLNWDLDMYYEPTDRPFLARALNVTEDLGQIQYIFSDKTGTLTENEMVFRCCSVGGRNYPHTLTTITGGKGVEGGEGGDVANDPDSGNFQEETDFPSPPSSKLVLDAGLVRDVENTGLCHDYLQDFFVVLALCNTVVLSRKTQDTQDVPDFSHEATWDRDRLAEYVQTITYEAESPDEAALVEAARSYGYALVARSPGRAVVTTPTGRLLVYHTLHVLEFDSERKCMSVVVKEDWSGRILLYSKGADTVIFSNLAHPDTGVLVESGEEEEEGPGEERRENRRELTENRLTLYAKEGLRTLCMARRVLGGEEYGDWVEGRREAEVALEQREEKLFASAKAIESQLELLGATGIEDRLQNGVPETIESLRMAGIKVWVLTGDKQETAINVGFSSRLVSENMDLIKINASSLEETREILECRRREFFDSDSDYSTDSSQDSRLSTRPLAFLWKVGRPRRGVGRREGGKGEERPKALVIDGGTLPFVLDTSLKSLFLDVASQCVSVICSRATPIQKASVVGLVKTGLNQMTLAVGDGANDVSMIQTANIGVGIAGREGMQTGCLAQG
ncbi:Phospholipid-transporting ATPase ID [Geodia barretti]|uniref:Phospholipid-transporting ATPase n=1 Tax=Geodia barretti TaxID=519541 RepID=A0AA35STJ4_GEOBA|nr:Phospholipid-transporting ATPase ID [Geodia barretti]